VLGLLANPQICSAILMGIESRVDPQAVPKVRDLSDKEFKFFYDTMKAYAAWRPIYETSGTLVNVGWGAGDHVNVGSNHLPAGPNHVCQYLSSWVTHNLTEPPKPKA
jgi:hypothetical protein